MTNKMLKLRQGNEKNLKRVATQKKKERRRL
jgi:hypothetical protein